MSDQGGGVLGRLRGLMQRKGQTGNDAQQDPPVQRRMIGKYVLGETLGVGGYSKVKLGIDTENNRKVALKIMMADPETQEISESHKKQLIRELKAMQKVRHENVIELYEWDENALYPTHDNSGFTPCVLTVLELAPGGELFDFLMYTGHFDEVTTRTYFHQLMGGIGACHDAGLAHRDIKPENLLLDANYNLKIADFGFAKEFRSGDVEFLMATACGTRGYLSPELLRGEKYSHKADLFACGIILFTLYAGFPPFQHALNTDWWWNKLEIRNYPLFWMAHERTRTFPDPLKELLQNMLHSNPDERYGMEQIQATEWYQGPTLSARELRKHLSRRRKLVQKERAKKAQQQQQNQQFQATPATRVVRAGVRDDRKDDENKRQEEDTGVDLPPGAPTMMFQQVQQLGDREIFEQAIEDIGDAEVVDSYFQFTAKTDPRETIVRLQNVANANNWKVQLSAEHNLMLIHAGIIESSNRMQTVVFAIKQYRLGDKYRVAFKRYEGGPLKFTTAVEMVLNHAEVIAMMATDVDIAEAEAEGDDEAEAPAENVETAPAVEVSA